MGDLGWEEVEFKRLGGVMVGVGLGWGSLFIECYLVGFVQLGVLGLFYFFVGQDFFQGLGYEYVFGLVFLYGFGLVEWVVL